MRGRLIAGFIAGVFGLLWMPVSSLGDLHHELSLQTASATNLRAAIAAESRNIAATSAGVRAAESRLASLQAQVTRSEAQLAAVQRNLVAARGRLLQLENRLHVASLVLAANLRAAYEDAPPDVVTVVLESHGFADMLERLDFMERVQHQDATIVSDTKTARAQVIAQARRLDALEVRDRNLTAQVISARNGAAAIQGALLERQAAQLSQRANTAARLSRVRAQIASIQHRIAILSRPPAVATTTTTPNAALPIDPGGMAQAPAGAPAAVRQVIAAGNAIAGLPYVWGGGHGSFHAGGYDCSGSVSYALAAAGLLSSPLDSTGFESWGQPGPGRWITVYANAGHAWMVVAGWRFDTVALAADGTRWTRTMTSTAGFVARHPAGL